MDMKKLVIGGRELPSPIILGPMAGVTDLPFRVICARRGAGLVCMEMVSAKAISYKNKNTTELLKVHPEEGALSLQLFGREPDLMAEVVKGLDLSRYMFLDINMGCPVPKIVNNGEGSALMKEPLLAGEIIEKIVKASSIPVTVKIRKGFTPESSGSWGVREFTQADQISDGEAKAEASKMVYYKPDYKRTSSESLEAFTITNKGEVPPPDPGKKVKTGDESHLALWASAAGIAVLLLLFMLIRKKKTFLRFTTDRVLERRFSACLLL